MQDVQPVNLLHLRPAKRVGDRPLPDRPGKLLPPSGAQALGIPQSVNGTLPIENDGARDNRPGQRASPHFVNAGRQVDVPVVPV